MYQGAIFDLDGVLVDTARYHYQAWKRLAAELGFAFLPQHNEDLKGVSRMRSLEILLEVGGLTKSEAEKEALAAQKNEWYVALLRQIDESELLGDVKGLLLELRRRGVKTAIGSASRNTGLILERTGIAPLFDAVIDGNSTAKAKPDPSVFLLAAQALGLRPEHCVVFEDAQAGVAAAKAAGMAAIGIGDAQLLAQADFTLPSADALSAEELDRLFGS